MSVQQVLDGAKRWGVAVGDCLESLRAMPGGCVQCCVTSPPYYAIRDYGVEGQIGLESTPEEFISKLVMVFRQVRRVLRDDGTLWINIGDTYANKSLIGVPWMLAFALRTDGWYLRSECIWFKPNVMPESVRDRPARAHEQMFLLSKSPRYYYDAEATREKQATASRSKMLKGDEPSGRYPKRYGMLGGHALRGRSPERLLNPNGGLKRSVWRVPTKSYSGSHYATYPPKLVEPCILAGTSAKGCCPACWAPWVRVVERKRVATRPGKDSKVTGDTMTDGNRDPQRHVTSTETTGWAQACECEPADPIPCLVIDPFVGSGTTLQVANEHGRRAIGCDLDERNLKLIRGRMELVQPMFAGL